MSVHDLYSWSFRCPFRAYPQIVQLLGVVTTDTTYFGIVVERFKHGDLRTLLDNEDTHLDDGQKLLVITDIAMVRN